MVKPPRATPTKAQLRRLLAKLLPTSAQLDGFFVDHFPDVAAQRSEGMSRTTRENLLLETKGPAEILKRLTEVHPEAAELLFELVQPVDIGAVTLSPDLLDRILAIVPRVAWSSGDLTRAYYRSAPPEWRCQFDKDCGANLAQRMCKRLALALGQHDGAHPILRFALHLIGVVARSDAADLAHDLLAWFQDAAAYLSVSAVTQQELQRQVESVAPEDDRELFLVVVMTRDADQKDGCILYAHKVLVPPGKETWSEADAEPIEDCQALHCRESDLIEVVGSLFSAIEGDLSRVGDHRFTIELVLPVDLLNLEVDRWRLDPTMAPLGASHHVVLRSWERAYGIARNPALASARRKWVAKWKQIHGTCDRVAWACTDEDAMSLGPKLHDGPACVAFRFAPGRGADGVSVLRDLIYAGAPIAVWPRASLADEARFQADVDHLVTHAQPVSWHEAVKGYRSAAFKEKDAGHPGHHLALLRDDPNKVLRDARLRAPAR